MDDPDINVSPVPTKSVQEGSHSNTWLLALLLLLLILPLQFGYSLTGLLVFAMGVVLSIVLACKS